MINVVYEKKDDLTVLYDSNNGTGDIYVDEKNPYIYEEEVTVLPNMFTAPEGYHFVGWEVRFEGIMPTSVDENEDEAEVKEIIPGDILEPGDKFKMPAYDVTLVAQWQINTYKVTFKAGANGSLSGTTEFNEIEHGTTWGAAEITVPTPVANSGYYFSGWAPSLPGNDYLITEDLEFIANFTRRSRRDDDDDDDDDRGGGTSKPTPVVVEIPDEEIPAGLPQLNKEDHFQYIQGYPDGTVKPLAYITRDEVAAVFYRLLDKDYRESIKTETHDFSDVVADRWSNRYIATLANGGIVTGYEDGTFRPGNYITRAEMAVIASRFDKLTPFESDQFSDIAGHWANKYINSAAAKGWIKGYSDGTFKPDQYITRAEFVTLVNNVLGRKVTKGEILPDAKKFPDLPEDAWYYEAMMEAINSHYYYRLEDDTEDWTEIYYPDLDM